MMQPWQRLWPLYRWGFHGQFQRSEEKDGKVIITSSAVQKRGNGLAAVLAALANAPGGRNPVTQMYQELSGVRLADMQPDQGDLDARTHAEITDAGERQNAMMATGIIRLTAVPANHTREGDRLLNTLNPTH